MMNSKWIVYRCTPDSEWIDEDWIGKYDKNKDEDERDRTENIEQWSADYLGQLFRLDYTRGAHTSYRYFLNGHEIKNAVLEQIIKDYKKLHAPRLFRWLRSRVSEE